MNMFDVILAFSIIPKNSENFAKFYKLCKRSAIPPKTI